MKKILFSMAIVCLFMTSCNKKPVETTTVSGLLPSKFEYKTDNGYVNKLYVIKNAQGMEVTVINIGARIVSIAVPDKDGNPLNVVLGYDSIAPYLQLGDYYGAIVGRYANRIANGTFELDRVTYRVRQNEGKNILHGGPRGFHTCYFTIEQAAENQLICTYYSKDDEQGFPGNVDLTVTYSLTDDNALKIDYQATTDKTTLINVSNHAYFNLSGAQSATFAEQSLYIDAAKYTPTTEDLIPTGEISPVQGVLDFTSPRTIDTEYQYDLNYVLNHPGDISNLAGKLQSAITGIGMEIYTTEPGLQFYNDKKRIAFVLETQHFPDSPHYPNFPSTILQKDSVFNSQTIYKFNVNSHAL
jgi:aldose 1-epimerase